MAEEEVLIEVQAAESVYGDDCVVIEQYPPHLNLLIRPRTADVSSQQFVEAVIGIRASAEYPDEPPHIMIVDSKGLDEQRQKHLITSIHNKALELSSNSMLVALYAHKNSEDRTGTCPMCRKVFHSKDIEHVLDLVGAYSQLNLGNLEDTESDVLLHSDSENSRRQKFEAILKLQQENNGLIEPKKTEVLMPGMFLPRPATTTTTTTTTTAATTTTTSDKETAKGEQATESKTNGGILLNKPSSSNRRSSGPRSKYRGRNSRTQVNRQWIIKENGNVQ